MRIKKLELIGFKSFKDRTVIHFDQGITGIVGPNGCGKSNIVDALVWVMGEMSAKHLRGAQMSDVIFGGAEGYAPMGMAEVSLTLENDGGPFPIQYLKHSEIMITRRLHRDGESEYLINKEPARLRDIHEVFMDTGAGSKGFSIIEQGAIGKIITAKPEDRRTLIEEAAGITKFKVRKRESQRKLVSTEQNLVRLQDILGEQRRQLDSLERQAQRAERYRNLKRELQEKEISVSSKTFLALSTESVQLKTDVETAREQEAGWSGKVATMENELATLRLQALEQEKSVEAVMLEHQRAQTETQTLEFQIRELNFEIEQARRSKAMTGSMLEQSRARKLALDNELKTVEENLAASREKAEHVGAEYQTKAAELSTIQARISQLDNQLTTERREMLTVSQSETTLDVRFQTLNEKVREQGERLEQIRQVEAELTSQRSEFEGRRNQTFGRLEGERQLQLDIMKDVENFQANYEILQRQVAEKQEELTQFKDSLNEVASRLYGLENLQANFEGFEEGVKQVMMWQRAKSEAHADGSVSMSPAAMLKPVAEIVEVPEKYELAMEAALGSRLQLLVSDSGENALSALDYLKSGGKGRSSFVASDWVSGAADDRLQELKMLPGVQAILSDVARIPEDKMDTVKPFFDGVVVVDSIRTALSLRPNFPGRTFVTLEGDALSADGVLTGGTAESADSGLLKRRREIKELSQQREEWAGKLALAKLSLQKLEERERQVGVELENARKRNNEKEILIAELKKDLERAENELQNATVAVQRQQNEVNREQANAMKLESEVEDIGGRLTEMRERRIVLESSVKVLDGEYQSSRAGIEDMQRNVTQLQVDASSTRKDVEVLTQRFELLSRNLGEINQQVEQMSSESDRSTETLSVNQVLVEQRKLELENAIDKAKDLAERLAMARDQFEQMQTTLRASEASVGETHHAYHQLQSRMNEATLRLEQVRMKEQYLIDQINERYMQDLREIALKYQDVEIDTAALEREVTDLKSKLNKIGEVNLSSIEEYEDLKSRHDFLDQQYKDLIEAKEQLKKVIDRINRICSRRFKETFEQVNERFTKVFPVLFGGGEARLILVEDPENGEMGIDIVSRPPGKKLQNVSLLSGGEKALTAVSLIFSIFLVKPSPFCLLDEVDAPLDDANVFRFNDLVKEMAKRSQIIIVTHNKHTMKVNNTLYGVTMEEKGVSKMVSVSLDQAERVVSA
ncbi:MAG TPA: chromosome segregation protein SMC [Bdellovibrionales bacterium]|nr:chromosome segregation protein SMC [Bdellovibrionales bacterium]